MSWLHPKGPVPKWLMLVPTLVGAGVVVLSAIVQGCR